MNTFQSDVSLLKYFYEERERIHGKIREYLMINTYRAVIDLCKDSIDIYTVPKAIKEILSRSERPWFDFTIELYSLNSSSIIKKVFILGERSIIQRRLKGISESILSQQGLRAYCVWVGFDLKTKPDIQDLLK